MELNAKYKKCQYFVDQISLIQDPKKMILPVGFADKTQTRHLLTLNAICQAHSNNKCQNMLQNGPAGLKKGLKGVIKSLGNSIIQSNLSCSDSTKSSNKETVGENGQNNTNAKSKYQALLQTFRQPESKEMLSRWLNSNQKTQVSYDFDSLRYLNKNGPISDRFEYFQQNYILLRKQEELFMFTNYLALRKAALTKMQRACAI